MNNLTDKAAAAKLILVPKGDDSRPCLQAFEDATGIKVPAFENRKLEVVSDGRTFFKVKGSDIPALIEAGYGDVGLTGSDSCEEYMTRGNSIEFESIGERMCRFVLLSPANKARQASKQLSNNKTSLQVATSFPMLLKQCAMKQNLNLSAANIIVSGSVEIMPRLIGVPLIADLVSSGGTAKANGLVEIQTLLDIYPAIVVKTSASTQQNKDIEFSDIERIDTTLSQRSKKVKDASAKSYTLTLMRDANKAGKKAGEEFGEVMMAIAGNGSTADCESEIADLTYAQLVAAYSRGKPVKLSNIIKILIDRNQDGNSSEKL